MNSTSCLAKSVCLVVLVLVTTSCPTPPAATAPTVSAFSLNNGSLATTSRTVTLNNACANNPTQYTASESAGFAGATWKSYSTAPTFVLSSGDGDKTVYFKVKNSAGQSNVSSATIALSELILPEITAFSINNGADSTLSRTVTLNNTCTNGPTHYMASEASDFSGASWEAYATAPSFTVSAGAGTKTVYFKVKNVSGESEAEDESITLSSPPAMQDLGTLGGSTSTAKAINNSGQIAGFADIASELHRAFIWDTTNGMQDLGVLPSHTQSVAYGINDSGQVVGSCTTAADAHHAFIWDATNGMQALAGFTAESVSEAFGINNAGQVVGYASTSGGALHAFLWDSTNGMQDLGVLSGDSNSQGLGINSAGQVVGQSYIGSTGPWHAFIWDSTNGIQAMAIAGGANAINASGQVAGWTSVAGGYQNAFYWTSGGGMLNLGTLGGNGSVGYGINNLGQVVGKSEPSGGGLKGFIWDSTNSMQVLGTLTGYHNSEALGINNSGQVVGYMQTPGYARHAF
ncbi:MAG: DUF3466 family protein, partial [Candidatus Hydrogenedentales bacterium]